MAVPRVAVAAGVMDRPAARRRRDRLAHGLFLAASLFGVVALALLLAGVALKGWSALSWTFLTSFPSRFPQQAGIRSAVGGSLWLLVLTGPMVFVWGVGAAIYLEEYARQGRLNRIIQANLSNLAGVPSIVYGLLGLALFVRVLALGRSLLAGALTMTLLLLPLVIVATQEAIRAVPKSLRDGALALGATRWQTVRLVVLPAAMPGILTGMILAVSRGLGETAPLIAIGALAFVAFTPSSPLDPFTVLPIQIFNWTSRPQEAFRELAAAGILVLLGVLLALNGLAAWLRDRAGRGA